jgi:sulfur carrier protein
MAYKRIESLPIVVSFFYLGNKHGISRGDDLKIIINGKEEIIEQDSTIAGLIVQKALNPATIIVEYNYDLIKKEAWKDIILKEDDRLEILRFVGGG